MSSEVIQTIETPQIAISECFGDLVVRGSATREVRIKSDGASSTVERADAGSAVSIRAASDCRVVVPVGSDLVVGESRGNVRIVGVRGTVGVRSASGDVLLRGVGATEVQEVDGDLTLRDLVGSLQAGRVGGDVRIRGMEGDAQLMKVGGDVRARSLRGGLVADHVGGSARLDPPIVPNATFRLTVGGGLRLYLAPDASIRFSVRSGGRLRSSVPGLQLTEDGEGVVGAGEAELVADVGGSIHIRPAPASHGAGPAYADLEGIPDLSGIGDMIEVQIAGAMAGVEAHVAQALKSVDSDEMRRVYDRRAERLLGRAEEFAKRESRRAERLAEQARMRAERAERRWRRASGQPIRPAASPPSDDERLRILRMVENGRLNPEEAADLLAALEGH